MKTFLKCLLYMTPLYSILRNYRYRKNFQKIDFYDQKRLDFYSRLINPGDVIFDVGANLGNRTKIFLNLKTKVVAFEPQKSCADFLAVVLKNRNDFILVRKALGALEGEAEIFINDIDTISSLSQNWIEATQKSGRFSEYEWYKKQPVQITTLDKSIREYGEPSFIKIDVEGYEFEVLSGLSQPIKCISIEFTPEYIENTYKCIDHMVALSDVEFQISMGETMEFALPDWVSAPKVKEFLSNIEQHEFGDVYIRRAVFNN